jgi:hypothetical protein
MTQNYSSQNSLLLKNLMNYYNNTGTGMTGTGTGEKKDNLERMLRIINGDVSISLRIVDWFTTNYAKKYYTVYDLPSGNRFKVYNDYKLKLRSYSKKRFDPFCRWDRISIPYKNDTHLQTTIGQLNFFKWAFENNVIDYIETNYAAIEKDMNNRNSTSKRKLTVPVGTQKRRKQREELSISATKSIKKEEVEIVIKFD